MKTNLYIDGFNLYYGCLKAERYSRWLDLEALARKVLSPGNRIQHIHYFTAPVHGTRDPDGEKRQQVYLRALEAYIPHLTIHYGRFQVKPKTLPDAHDYAWRTVLNTEEKGSDVNLAVHLLNDCWLERYECAVVVSNDSDLSEAIRLVKQHHPQKVIGVLAPVGKRRRANHQLTKHADFVKSIRTGDVRASQLPDRIPGTKIHRPAEWC